MFDIRKRPLVPVFLLSMQGEDEWVPLMYEKLGDFDIGVVESLILITIVKRYNIW